MSTAGVNLDTSQYVRINQGLNPVILQAHGDGVRIAFSDQQPVKGNPSFHLLRGGSEPYPIRTVDENVWALATSDKSSLVITEFNTPGDDNIITLDEIAKLMVSQIGSLIDLNSALLDEIRLLNARVEEGFETGITINDIEEH